MPMPVITTKLYIPSFRSSLVARPYLVKRMNAGLDGKLTLISAPAGFGKTTIVSEWVNNLRLNSAKGSEIINRVAWLSLDKGDDDYVRFLSYFIAALQAIEIRHESAGIIGQGALGLLQSPHPPPPDAVLTSVLNEIASLSHRILLVLDDYHLIDAQPIHEALNFLIEHLAPRMHIVIVTRDDPPLPLARLRARGEMTELRAADLRFSSTEAAGFLNRTMGLGLSTEEITVLEARTEGWIAGLRMAAISIQGHDDAATRIRSFTGSHRFVMDYLIEEVLCRLSEGDQAFLLQTAVLAQLSGSLCDALTGRDDGQASLEKLENANLFIVALDNERCWYRYHHLFADLLRQRLRQTHPAEIPTLHHQASEWYEKNGFGDEAIEHALQGDDFERMARLIDEYVDALWERGEHTKLRRWLQVLPVEFVYSKPNLCIFHAWYLSTRGRLDAAERSLQAAEQALGSNTQHNSGTTAQEQDRLSGLDESRLRGRAAVMRSFWASHRGNVPAIIQHSHQALKYLPQQDHTWRSTAAVALGDAHGIKGDMVAAYRARIEALETSKAAGNRYMTMVISLKLGMILREQGRLRQTIEICRQQMQLADESGLSHTAMAGGLLAVWGEALVELDDLEGSLHLAKRGIGLAERGTDVGMLGWCYVCLTRVLLTRKDTAGAEDAIRKMENATRKHDMALAITNLMAACRARIWLAQGKLDDASQWAVERGLHADGELNFLAEIEYIVLARILIAQGRIDEADELLRRLLEQAQTGGRTSRMIEIMTLQALAFQAGCNTLQALATLEQAFALAEPEDFIRIFVDEGPPMARLLYEAVARGIAPNYARRLLSAFPVAEPEQVKPLKSHTPKSELIEPPSKRELEVLQLIAEGLTNQEIGSRLFISLSTVKVHTRNVYGKLDVHSRTKAVAKAKALGILPSI